MRARHHVHAPAARALTDHTRRGNTYCRDLRDVLAAGARRGSPSAEASIRFVAEVVARLRAWPGAAGALGPGIRARVGREALRSHVLPRADASSTRVEGLYTYRSPATTASPS